MRLLPVLAGVWLAALGLHLRTEKDSLQTRAKLVVSPHQNAQREAAKPTPNWPKNPPARIYPGRTRCRQRPDRRDSHRSPTPLGFHATLPRHLRPRDFALRQKPDCPRSESRRPLPRLRILPGIRHARHRPSRGIRLDLDRFPIPQTRVCRPDPQTLHHISNVAESKALGCFESTILNRRDFPGIERIAPLLPELRKKLPEAGQVSVDRDGRV